MPPAVSPVRLLPPIEGLEELWAAYSRRGPAVESEPARLLLDILGLGLEQTIRQLGQTQMGWAAFQSWVVATAGIPDPLVLARYHATIAGGTPPPAVRARLAQIDAAPPALDEAALARWARDGYTVLRGAISRAEAASAAQAIWTAIGATADDPASWYRERDPFWVPLYQHAALEVARRSARVHKAFAQLWGTADLWMTCDKTSFNPPEHAGWRFAGSPLHWDTSLMRPIPFATQGILYLTDTTGDGGALRLVPGFHHRLDAWLDALGDADPRTADLPAAAVTIPADAGDLVIWRHELPHGASPNRAGTPRLAQYVNMRPTSFSAHPAWR